MKKVAVIGHGYVGSAVERFFSNHFEVVVYDPKYLDGSREPQHVVSSDQHVRFLTNADADPKAEANACDLAVVCVPTPASENGSVDTSYVEEVVGWLETPVILVKSSIPPGTTDRLKRLTGKRVCFSPEYIGEGKYVVPWWKDKGYAHPTDMKFHDFQIVGGERADCREILEFFKKVTGPEPRYMATDAKTAELCKYMENSWGATKVTFCNEFAKIAEAMGVDYDELRELWMMDGRVERMHTAVFKDSRGFGGKCFPKDVCGVVAAATAAGHPPRLLTSVLIANAEIRDEPIPAVVEMVVSALEEAEEKASEAEDVSPAKPE